MSVANLHSVLNDRWFIEKAYGHSLLPSLFAILKGNDISIKSKERVAEVFISKKGAQPIAATIENTSSKDNYVLVMNLKNPIYKYNQECGPEGTKTKIQTLEAYKNDINCVGVVLDIDSGGGQVSGTPEFHDYLLNYTKPIVAYTDGMMCSAAYYIGSATNHIVANKRAEHIGSIGTMVSFIDWTGYVEKEGGKVITEYATKSTEKNRAFEELLQGKPELYIKSELDPINEQFHADVAASRPGINEEVFAGGTWNASESLDKKLIDSIGTLQDAISKVFELSKSNTNKTSTNKSNNTMSTTKNLPRVEAVLGLEAPLAISENGVFLQSEQLDTVEGHLESLETSNATLTTQLTDANTAHQSAIAETERQLTGAQSSLTTVEASVDATLTNAGLPVEGTLTEKLTALNAYAALKGAKDGASHTKLNIDANANDGATPSSALNEAIKNS